MNRFKKLLLFILISLAMGSIIQAQSGTGIKDTLSIKEQKDNKSNTKNPSQENENKTGVKKVRSARPDMSRARGARPPYITRPSGSGIPKGTGRPGGAKGPGSR